MFALHVELHDKDQALDASLFRFPPEPPTIHVDMGSQTEEGYLDPLMRLASPHDRAGWTALCHETVSRNRRALAALPGGDAWLSLRLSPGAGGLGARAAAPGATVPATTVIAELRPLPLRTVPISALWKCQNRWWLGRSLPSARISRWSRVR